jgi:hypothetical protein
MKRKYPEALFLHVIRLITMQGDLNYKNDLDLFIIHANCIKKYQLKIFHAKSSNVKVTDALVLSNDISAAYATYHRAGT